MNVADLRSKTEDELNIEVKKLTENLADVSRKVVEGKEKNKKKPYMLKRDIARLKTLITEKRILRSMEVK